LVHLRYNMPVPELRSIRELHLREKRVELSQLDEAILFFSTMSTEPWTDKRCDQYSHRTRRC
jgi:hypothetical protein